MSPFFWISRLIIYEAVYNMGHHPIISRCDCCNRTLIFFFFAHVLYFYLILHNSQRNSGPYQFLRAFFCTDCFRWKLEASAEEVIIIAADTFIVFCTHIHISHVMGCPCPWLGPPGITKTVKVSLPKFIKIMTIKKHIVHGKHLDAK